MPLFEIKKPAKRCPTCHKLISIADEWDECCMKYLGSVFQDSLKTCSHWIGYVNAHCVQCGKRDPNHKGH